MFQIIDAYLAYILITGVIQFVYCALVGTFPFNSFLSGFISCVASFVLAGKLIGCTLVILKIILCSVQLLLVDKFSKT